MMEIARDSSVSVVTRRGFVRFPAEAGDFCFSKTVACSGYLTFRNKIRSGPILFSELKFLVHILAKFCLD